MTVKITISLLILILFNSCQQIEDDEKILNIILKESNYTINDSIYFDTIANDKKVFSFFKHRNNKNIVFKHIYKNNIKPKPNDSSFYEIDSVVKFEQPLKGNNYIMTGKGKNKIVEKFLKDSFNYQNIETKTWNINKNIEKSFTQKKNKKIKHLTISKPVYNLAKNKAIIYKSLGGQKYLETIIYFLSKEEQKWEITYTETTHSFLD
ncbi:hypothetical protein ACW5R3_07120 [Bizionia sp. KMM 8389]